ncbi:CHASE2 domain-containing protein [Sediminitomix flava]|uniref:CHASE2 domain-containing sensor protein n=1 Tax=Sediminitomix flava TaxID=379075 RepID=A0A315ZHM9_SEDFL|nr:CHASE2 domain-containing protein [Sediminitomix flava]PWJ44802.1 CHASE2 domain-containing sensor protein [Sediminitomix flava]
MEDKTKRSYLLLEGLKQFFHPIHFAGTVFVFLFMYLLQLVGVQTEIFNVFESVFEEFELTDIYYRDIRNPQEETFEENVILVNIGHLPRRAIAEQINILNKYEPAVIGIDAVFAGPKEDDPMGDFLLAQAVAESNKFVFASTPLEPTRKENIVTADSIGMPYELFLANDSVISTGHVYTGNEYADFTTWREVPVFVDNKGKLEPSLAAEVVRQFDEEKYKNLLKRERIIEPIYFKGNLDKYLKLDPKQVLLEEFDTAAIKGKIVLMGYMGDEYTDYFFAEDKFYTPLNKNLLGRGFPDMYGVVVHANIISMMLNDTYIDAMPQNLSLLIAVLLCFFNVSVFTIIVRFKRMAVWYNAISKTIQLVEAIIVTYLSIMLFAEYHYEVNFSLAFLVILLSGDLTEIFVEIIVRFVRRVLRMAPLLFYDS